jgi:acetyl esterase/lipase
MAAQPTTTTADVGGASTPVAVSDPVMQVRVPDGTGPFPALVLLHGGGWVAGAPSDLSNLARFLTGEGYLTLSTAYTLANGVPGFPAAIDDVACAARHAAAHPESDGTVAIVGFSAGAHIGALAALDDGSYGGTCSLTEPVVADRLVGMAGPYDVTRLGALILPFFGVSPSEDPDLWVAGNPLLQAARNPDLDSLLLHAGNDGLVDLDFADDFAAALSAAGSEVLVEVVEGARHGDLQDPDVVGDLVAAWLAREG